MTFLYPNPVLQMKYSFWRINLHVLCRSGYRSKCKRCTQRWSFLADWKRLMLQKGFSHSFWCTRDTWSFLLSNSVCFWRKGKCFTLLLQPSIFFQAAIIFATNFSAHNVYACFYKHSCIRHKYLLLKKSSIFLCLYLQKNQRLFWSGGWVRNKSKE